MQAELRFRIDLNSVFPNLFKFPAPFDGSKKISDTPNYNILWKKKPSSIFGSTPRTFQGTRGCRDIPVENHAWMRKKFAKIKKRI